MKFWSVLLICVTFVLAEEGMILINELETIDLKERGLQVTADDIFNPADTCLIDGIVKLNGCTGSFVSSQGLILTNHHCAYGAAQAASDAEHDYMANGFLAQNKSQEITAKGASARIIDSYTDVSAKVLQAVNGRMTFFERTKAIELVKKELVSQAERENPGKRAEVSEMFPGKKYILFIYTYLKDVRLVYFPPTSIGEFGGEIDNWMWPRHTGDFAFMRAYVSPDGEPAEYSPENVPYTPKKVLAINSAGVNEEDGVFILGYPGSTFRHRTSHFVDYEQNYRRPWLVDWWNFEIDLMQEMGKSSREVAIRHMSRIKRLSNNEKKYRGVLQGLERTNLLDEKIKQEKELSALINDNDSFKILYGELFGDIKKIYDDKKNTFERELILNALKSDVQLFYFAHTVYEASLELSKPDLERKSAYMDRTWPLTKKRLMLAQQNYYEKTDKRILTALFEKIQKLDPKIQEFEFLVNLSEDELIGYINDLYDKSFIGEVAILTNYLENPKKMVKKSDDSFILLAKKMYETYSQLSEKNKTIKGELDKLYAQLVDVKQMVSTEQIVPDANSTMRFTSGYIRSYSPSDGVIMQPITSLKGLKEKNTGTDPFDAPELLLKKIEQEKNPVPVCMLYDTDTTGGNSGSPVFNAYGDLVGLNFDRTFEATINDFAWNAEYSRSIGVDIRYILWITKEFAGADWLLNEMRFVDE